MSTEAADPPAKRRFGIRPRFSLRLFLLAVTAFAIGFPLWYRWPYQEVRTLSPSIKNTALKIEEKRITTWQRQWGGGKVKHGPETHLFNGKVVNMTTYRNGIKHGPYVAYRIHSWSSGTTVQEPGVDERPFAKGQYVNGEKHGEWINVSGDTIIWNHGQRQSPRPKWIQEIIDSNLESGDKSEASLTEQP